MNDELDNDARELLALVRNADPLPDAVRERVRGAAAAAIAAGTLTATTAAASSGAAGAAATGAKAGAVVTSAAKAGAIAAAKAGMGAGAAKILVAAVLITGVATTTVLVSAPQAPAPMEAGSIGAPGPSAPREGNVRARHSEEAASHAAPAPQPSAAPAEAQVPAVEARVSPPRAGLQIAGRDRRTPADRAPTPSAAETPRYVELAPAPEPVRDPALLESEILARAVAALGDGQPGAALTHLREHAEQFPHGVLAQERELSRIRALCALGDVTAAEGARRRFLGAWPASPLAAQARAVDCDGR
jgi:hypothetical protein